MKKQSHKNNTLSLNNINHLMPHDKAAVRILNERAQFISVMTKVDAEVKESEEYIQFKLGDKSYYGISYQFAEEVLENVHVTHLPHVPSYVSGVINWNGLLLTVLNLKILFGLTQTSQDLSHYVIVVNINGVVCGIEVANIEGSDSYDPTKLGTALSNTRINSKFILGLHKSKTAIINMEYVFNEIQDNLSNK